MLERVGGSALLGEPHCGLGVLGVTALRALGPQPRAQIATEQGVVAVGGGVRVGSEREQRVGGGELGQHLPGVVAPRESNGEGLGQVVGNAGVEHELATVVVDRLEHLIDEIGRHRPVVVGERRQ